MTLALSSIKTMRIITKMAKRFWKGEVQHKGHLQIDFPPRETKEEAFRDAEDRCLDSHDIPCACEWEGDADYSVSTGEVYSGPDSLDTAGSTMSEQEFIAKYQGKEQGFWLASACALFWARSYRMPQPELLVMSQDYMKVPIENRAPCSHGLALRTLNQSILKTSLGI